MPAQLVADGVVWTQSKPPSPGWWPARLLCPEGLHREFADYYVSWFDGRFWSVFALKRRANAETAKLCASQRSGIQMVWWAPRPSSWPPESLT